MAIFRKLRLVWATLGTIAFVVFTTWSLLAFRANAHARAALQGDGSVSVTARDDYWAFMPRRPAAVGLAFFPGGMVDPVAYAAIARAVASGGYAVVLVRLPRRGAFGGADGPTPLARLDTATRGVGVVRHWVVAGHSRGGVVAARAALRGGDTLAGLVLIGTSHPRDFSLAHLKVPVARVFGTRDTVADAEKLEATRHNLPPHTRHVRIDGGNHSQFGDYGFQPGDWPATIDRGTQRRITVEAILSTLESAADASRGEASPGNR